MTAPLHMLDLFCKAGGASVGYATAFGSDTEIVGVDIEHQPNYPFTFVQMDAIGLLMEMAYDRTTKGFDFIHASPPCQRYSDLAKRNGNADSHPDLVPIVQELLQQIGLPYVIENVEGAPLRDPVTLCGTMFPGLRVLRHRQFECNFPVAAPAHPAHPLVFTYDKRKAHYGQLDQNVSFVQVTGGGNARVANKRAAMGIDWMTGAELNEAIPPAYARHIGEAFLKAAV